MQIRLFVVSLALLVSASVQAVVPTNLAGEGPSQDGPQGPRILAPVEILWDNGDTDGTNGYSNVTAAVFGFRRTVFDDFVVPDGEKWVVSDFHWIHLWNSLTPPQGTGLELTFRADAGSTPGAPIATANVNSYTESATGRVFFGRLEAESSVEFDAIVLGPGHYWFEATIVGPENNFWMIKAATREQECWVDYDDLGGFQSCSTQFGGTNDLSWYLTGTVRAGLSKEITSGNDFNFDGIPDRVVEVGTAFSGANYTFGIYYFEPGGPTVMIKDIVPREWNVVFLGGSGEPCSVIRADERRNLFSDNFITCYPNDDSEFLFHAQARCFDTPGDPSCHPYECGAFFLNEGAQTWVGRSLLDQTDPLCLAAVRDIDGGGLDYTGAGDEDGDGIDDYTEACVNFTDPCVPEPCGNCLVAHGTPGCDNALCEATVCALDSFCCDVQWDGICVGEAIAECASVLCVAPEILNFTPDPDYRRPARR